MQIDGITAKTVELLLKQDKPTTTAAIAEAIGVSQSSVKTHLKDARQLVESANGSLFNKPGVGVMLEADTKTRSELEVKISNNLDQSYFYYFRKKYILDVLFSDMTNYTIQMLASDLYVGKNIILKDLERIGQWLDQFDLKIVRKKHCGVVLSGMESNIRQALMEHNRKYGLPERADESGRTEMGLDCRLRKGFYDYLKKQYPGADILSIQDRLLTAERELGVIYTDNFFGRLLEYVLIAGQRVRRGCLIGKKDFADEIIQLPEYEIAAGVVKDFCPDRKERSYEIANLTAYFLAFKTQQGYIPAGTINAADAAACRRFVASVGGMLGISLLDDQELEAALCDYLRRFRLYKKYGIRIISTLNSEIRKNNPMIFTVCDLAMLDTEEQLGLMLTKNEIAEVALLVINSIGKNTRPIKAVLITGSDYQTSKYIANRVRMFLPQLEFSKIVLYQNAERVLLSPGELILSTITVPMDSVVLISKMVTDADIARIRKALLDREKGRNQTERARLFEQVFDQRLVVMDCDLKKRADIIRYGCELLQKCGKVKSGFLDSVLEREVFSPTAVGNGVSLPHGRQEQVLESSVAVIRMKKPVEWTDEERVDLAFVLALRFEERENLSVFFSRLYSLIEDEKILEEIRTCKTEEEIRTVIVSYCMEYQEEMTER